MTPEVVGNTKFQYDVWGDTVKIASLMESSGDVGMVNISSSSYELIKDKYSCEYRGELPVKGKGELDMYFVKEKK
jgi:class 3 adenylate cyclase